MRISDWSSDVCSSDLRFAELSWPWELSTAPNYIEFVGLDVESDAPSRQHPALIGKQGIETLIGRGQPRAQRLQCGCIGQSVKFPQIRSEESRVGNECVRTCRSRWSQGHKKKKKK